MSAPSCSKERVAALVGYAAELGFAIDEPSARRLFERFGLDGGVEQLGTIAGLRDQAARELRVRLSFREAHALLQEAHWNPQRARRRLPALVAARRAVRRPLTARELQELAAEHGLSISFSTARRYAGEAVHELPLALRKRAWVRDAASRRGFRVDGSGAAARVGAARGDVATAISRIERRARNRQRCQARRCSLLRRGGTRTQRIDASAWCKCVDCRSRLLADLAPYTRGVLRKCGHPPTQDVMQDAGEALQTALLDWTDGPRFAAFYGTVLANHLGGRRRGERTEKRNRGIQPVSLDAPLRADWPTTLAERIPGYSTDPLLIVLWLDEIAERRADRRLGHEDAILLYEKVIALR